MGRMAKMVMALVALSLLACAQAAGGEKKYRIAMLPQFKGENYFDGCHVGAKEAAADLKIELIYDGPNQSEATNAKQVEILNGFIAAGVDAIIISPCDTEGAAPTLRQAIAKGIKVVTFDSDTLVDARSFFVNQATADDIGSGLAEAVIPGLQANGFGPDKPARLGVIATSALDVNTGSWIRAIQKHIKANYPWLTLAADETGYLGGDIWTPGSDEAAAQTAAAEAIAKSGDAAGGKQLNAIIGTSSMATPALAAAWNAVVGTKPKVVLTGLATPLGIIDYILDPENPMKTGVLWDVGALGYLSVESTVALLDGKLNPATDKVFESRKLGTKRFAPSPEGDGVELLLGPALIFNPDNVENFNY